MHCKRISPVVFCFFFLCLLLFYTQPLQAKEKAEESSEMQETYEYNSFRVEFDKKNLSVKSNRTTALVVAPGCQATAEYTITNKSEDTAKVFLTELYAKDSDYNNVSLSKEVMDHLTMTLYLNGKQIYQGSLMGKEWMDGQELTKLRTVHSARLKVVVDVPSDIDNKYTNTDVIFIFRFQTQSVSVPITISAKTNDTLVMIVIAASVILLLCSASKKKRGGKRLEKA